MPQQAAEGLEALNVTLLKKFARLYLARKKLDEKSRQLGKQLIEMEPALIRHMTDLETNTVNFKGGITLKKDSTIYAKKKVEEKKLIIEALRKSGLDYLLAENYNSNSLSAYVRERYNSGKDLPEALAEVIEADPVEKLKVYKK